MKVNRYRCIKDYEYDNIKLIKDKLYDISDPDQDGNSLLFLKESWFQINEMDDVFKLEEGSSLKDSFTFAPFLNDEIIEKNFVKLKTIENRIAQGLKDYPNFQGIDFCDVNAKGIQIRGHHKDIKGYTYGDQITLKYDMSNSDEVVSKFIEMWKIQDTPEFIKGELDFIKTGEKHGWD